MCGYYFLLRFVDLSGPVCLCFFSSLNYIIIFHRIMETIWISKRIRYYRKNQLKWKRRKRLEGVSWVYVWCIYTSTKYDTTHCRNKVAKKLKIYGAVAAAADELIQSKAKCRTIIEICMIQGQTILLNKLILISRKKLPRLPSPSRSYSAKSREKTHHHRQRLSTNNNTSNNAQFRTRILKSKWTITGCFWCFAAICLARFFVQPLILTRFEYNANSIAIKILMAAFKKSRLRWGIMGFICERRAGCESTNERSNNRHNHTHTLLLNAFPLTFWSEAWHNVCVFFSAALSKWNSAISHTNRVSLLRRVFNVCPLVNKLINILHSVAHNIALRWRFRIIMYFFLTQMTNRKCKRRQRERATEYAQQREENCVCKLRF